MTNIAFSTFMEDACRSIARETPEFPTQMGLYEIGAEPVVQTGFAPIDDASALRRSDMMKRIGEGVKRFPESTLNSSEKISAASLEFFCRYGHERQIVGTAGRPFLRHEYLLRPSLGVQNDPVTFLSGLHPMRHHQDARDYIERLASIAPLLDEAARLTLERKGSGLLAPRIILEGALAEAKQFIAPAPEENFIYTTLAAKSLELTDLPAQNREALLADCASLLKNTVYPAYERLIATVEALIPKASATLGLWNLPDGAGYYDFLLRSTTTTSLDADDIHELGWRELARVEAEIIALSRKLGIEATTIAECHAAFDARLEAPRQDTEANRNAVLERMKEIIANVEPHLTSLFHTLPRARATVLPTPRFAEADRNHTYQPASLDGTRSGYFELNTKQALAEADSALKVVAYHEIYPGHHLQISLAQEDASLPTLRRIMTFDAYIEGWAKYAETMPARHGIDDDIGYRLTRLRQEQISTANLVLDTGIHAKRWTQEQAKSFFVRHTGKSDIFAGYIVRRSASVPAQLCSYKIGMMKFMEIRQRMEAALGASFDVRDFHDTVLSHGAVPLTLLDRLCDERIRATKA